MSKNKTKNSPRILFYDIESAPALGWVWGIWEQDVIEIEQDWFMLSFAYKWEGEKTVLVRSLPEFKAYKKDKINDCELVKELWKLMDEADIVVGHNVDGFDNKKANSRFLVHGLKPTAPYKTIDTLKIARKHFKFDSNRLDDLARYLKIGRKLPTSGKKTWLDCIRGNMKAWSVMTKYNVQDVRLLYGVHQKLHPWATNYLNMAVYVGEDGLCPHCTKDSLQKRGPGYTKTGVHQRFQCQGCYAWSRGKTEVSVEIR